MFPVLVAVYLRLARREDTELERVFGDQYRAYRKQVGRFLPWPTGEQGNAWRGSRSSKHTLREAAHAKGRIYAAFVPAR